MICALVLFYFRYYISLSTFRSVIELLTSRGMMDGKAIAL